MPSWSQDSYDYCRMHVVLLLASFSVKQGTIWSGNRTHERRVWTACFHHLSYSDRLLLVPFLGNAAVWHCKTQTVLATRPGVRSLTVLPAATSYKTPLVIITKRLSPFIVRPEAACSISELMLIVWIAVGVFHKAHSCSNFAGRLIGDSSYDFKSYAS